MTDDQFLERYFTPAVFELGLRTLAESIIRSTAEAWRGDGIGMDRGLFEDGLQVIAASRETINGHL
jgi:hypothetical protein